MVIPLEWKLAALFLGIVGIYSWGHHEGGLAARAAALQVSEKQAQMDAQLYQKTLGEVQQKASAYEQEVVRLKAISTEYPSVSVSVCPSTPSAHLPDPDQPRQDLPASPGKLPASPVGVSDIGQFLFAEADRADALVARCRAE